MEMFDGDLNSRFRNHEINGLLSEGSIVGKWWRPRFPDNKVEGILIFSQNDITLKLNGFFQDIKIPGEDLEFLLGEINKQKVTLYNVHIKKFSHINLSLEFRADGIFYGEHFSSVDKLKFNKLELQYSHLKEWLITDGFMNKHLKNENDVVYFKTKSHKIHNNFDINIMNFTKIIETRFKLEYEYKPLISVNSEEKKDLNYLLELMRSLQNLITLLLNCPGYPTYVVFDNKIQYYFLMAVSKEIVDNKLKNISKYLFNYEDIKNNFSNYFTEWVKNSQTLKPILDLYFPMIYYPPPDEYLTLQFLQIMMAIEGYHRIRYPDSKYVKDDEWGKYQEDLIKAIPKEIQNDHKDSLKSKIKYGNEFSLRKRLKQIIVEFWIGCLENFISDKNPFIDSILNKRNKLTHVDYTNIEEILSWQDLWKNIQTLKLIMTLLLLKETGISIEEIKEKVNLYYNSSFMKNKPPSL